jgi:small subunit ribosomal protein S13
MPRVLGVDIPKEKRIDISLTYLYGIGRALSVKVLKDIGIEPSRRAKDLNDEEVAKITNYLQKSGLRLEGDLRRDISQNIKRLMEIGSYRGSRHKKGLPARGQRTRTNSRTRKGPKKGGNMPVVKKEAPKAAAKPAK